MASSGGSPSDLPAGVRSLFNSHLYSDLQIRCKDGTIFNAHKAIVCPQSIFFANACNPEHGFKVSPSSKECSHVGVKNINRTTDTCAIKEAKEGMIDLSQDDPVIVEALLTHLYLCNYASQTTTCGLPFHVKMYAAGDYYQVPTLKELAKMQFLDLIKEKDSWNDPFLSEAIVRIYDSTPPADQSLRAAVISVARKNLGQLQKNQDFMDMANNLGEFSMDLAKSFYAERPNYEAGSGAYWCGCCAAWHNLSYNCPDSPLSLKWASLIKTED